MKDKIAKSVFWMAWTGVGLQIISFVSTMFVARLLDPSDYGIMAVAGIFISTIALLVELGLGAAIVQFRDLEKEELNACFWFTITIAAVAYVLLFLAAPAIAAWFGIPVLSGVLRVLGLMFPFAAVGVIPDGLLRKQLALDKVSQGEIISGLVALMVVLSLALAGAGVWALVGGALTMPLVASAVAFWFAPWSPGLSVQSRRLKELLSYSLDIVGGRACWATYQQADIFVLGKVSGDMATGLYAMALNIATLPASKISAVINKIATPLMAELQTAPEMMRRTFLRGVRLVTAVTFPLSIGMMFVAEDFIHLVLTDKWLPALPALQVLCLFGVIRSLDVLFPPVLRARNRTRFTLFYNLMLLGALPVAFWVGALWKGTVGVAWMWVLIYPLASVWMVHVTLREISLRWNDLWVQLRPPIVSTLVMSGVLLALRMGLSSWGDEHTGMRMATMILAGAIAYGAVMFNSSGPLIDEIKEIIGWVFRGGRVLARSQVKLP